MSNEFDITKYLVLQNVENRDSFGKRQKGLTTKDYVTMLSKEEIKELNRYLDLSGSTSFAEFNGNEYEVFIPPYITNLANVTEDDLTIYHNLLLRDGANGEEVVSFIASENKFENIDTSERKFGIPVKIAVDFHDQKIKDAFLDNVTEWNEQSVHSKYFRNITMGEYPQSMVDGSLYENLESLYKDKSEFLCPTGRVYTVASHETPFVFSPRFVPEFEYRGEKYARFVLEDDIDIYNLKWGMGTPIWFKVEPIKWTITNWKSLSRSINPKGKRNGTEIVKMVNCGLLAGLNFYTDFFEKNCNLWQNSQIRAFLNSSSNEKLGINANYATNNKFDISGFGFLKEAFDLTREPIKEYVFSPEKYNKCSDYFVASYAFAGCRSIEKLIIPRSVKRFYAKAFDGLDYKWAYITKDNKNWVLSNTLPENTAEYLAAFDIEQLSKKVSNFDVGVLLAQDNPLVVERLINKFEKAGIPLAGGFLFLLQYEEKLEDFAKNCNLKFLTSEINNLKELFPFDNYEPYSVSSVDDNLMYFLNLAYYLGCFSCEKIKDEYGKETQVVVGQKASAILAGIMRYVQKNDDGIDISEFLEMFDFIEFYKEISPELLTFLGQKNKNNFDNFILLLKKEKEYPGLIEKVFDDFKKLKKFRTTLGPNGTPKTVSWDEACKNFYVNDTFEDVDKKDLDIAELFAVKGLSPALFCQAVELRDQAIKQHVPEHILGAPLKEKTILQEIEEIKRKTQDNIDECERLVEQLCDKQFTYEMLSKRDANNTVMGLAAGCCATIDNQGYGGTLARLGVTANDVQNLAIRDVSGEIVAKGIMYVDPKGYIVINDFEINQKFKHHETDSGKYSVLPDDKEEVQREKIFEAFLRGVNRFVKEYDKLHPNAPIQKVTVGMGFNRLKRQCERYKIAPKNLKVPIDYAFMDASEEQRVIYDRNEEVLIENNISK